MKDEQPAVKRPGALKMAKAAAVPRPIFITKGNSLAATGQDLRFWKSNFPHLVRRVARRDVIVADQLEQEVSRTDAETPARQLATAASDPAEAVRQLLRRAGGQ